MDRVRVTISLLHSSHSIGSMTGCMCGMHDKEADVTGLCRISNAALRMLYGLQVLGISELTCLDVINVHILPQFQAKTALQLEHSMLASCLAFIGRSGLLTASVFDGPPDTDVGKKLLEQLRQSAVIATKSGSVRVGDIHNLPVHLPLAMLKEKDIKPVSM